MYIAIPVDNENLEQAKITTMSGAECWAVIDFDAGKMQNMHTAPNWQESGVDWLDFVVLENKFENTIDFLNEGIMVLIRRAEQESINDIIEAFKFKELDEAGF